MSFKSLKIIQKLILTKAYIDYWKKQNDPEYIKFWEELKSNPNKIHEYIFDPPKKEGESYFEWCERTNFNPRDESGPKMESWFVKKCKEFGVWPPLPDPYKKLDWMNFEKKPDPDVIESMNNAYAYAYPRKKFVIKIDPFDDDFEILYHVYLQVNFLRKFISTAKDFQPKLFLKRDHINKFPLYAQIWDLRRWERKTFSEISRILKLRISTISDRFYRAYELIFNEPFDNEFFEELWSYLPKERLNNYCEICPKRNFCKELCPDMILDLRSIEKKRNWREVQAITRKTKDLLGLDGRFDSTPWK